MKYLLSYTGLYSSSSATSFSSTTTTTWWASGAFPSPSAVVVAIINSLTIIWLVISGKRSLQVVIAVFVAEAARRWSGLGGCTWVLACHLTCRLVLLLWVYVCMCLCSGMGNEQIKLRLFAISVSQCAKECLRLCWSVVNKVLARSWSGEN